MTRRQSRAILALATLSLPTLTARANDLAWSTPTTGRWLDPTLWSTGTIPTTADTATLALTGPYTATLDAPTAVGPLTLNNPDATLLLDNTSASNFSFAATTALLSAGTLTLQPTHSGMSFNPTNLTNAATINFSATTATGTGTMAFISSNNIVNTGTIEAHDPVNPLTQPITGLPYPALYQIFALTLTNTGTLRTGANSYLTLQNMTLTQNAGLLDGNIGLSSGTLNYNGGSCSPTLPVTLISSTLSLAPTATAGDFLFNGGASTLKGDIPAGNSVAVLGSSLVNWTQFPSTGTFLNAGRLTIGSPNATTSIVSAPTFNLPSNTNTLLNTGTFTLNDPTVPAASFTGSITNHGALTVNLPKSATTTLNGSITNDGSISLAANTTLSTGSSFTQNAGSLTIAPAATLSLTNAHFYYNGGSISGSVSLTNSTLHLATALTNAGGTFIMSNSGSLVPFVGDIPAGVTVAPTASLPGNVPVNLAPFTNAGTLTTLITKIGSISYRVPPTGVLTNTGTITGTVDGVDRGATLRIAGALTNTGAVKAYNLTAGTFNQNAGTLDVDSTCAALNGTFNYNGGTLTGKPVLLYNSTLNIAPGTNPASFTFQAYDCALHGSPAPGSTLAIDSLSDFPANISVTADPFTNAGTLSLTATTYSVDSTLTLPTGTLTNTGTLSVTKGQGGGTRTINADILNSGTLTVGTGTTLTYTGSLTTSAPLDLQGTLLLTPTSSLTFTSPNSADTVRTLLSTAHITSTATDATHRLAYAPDSRDSTSPAPLLVKLSLTGDANLDGRIDPDDYALLDRSFAQSTPNAHWYEGDFNYDGLINDQDYLLLDATYLSTHPASPTFLARRESQFGPTYVTTLLATVPEPTLPLSSILYPLSSLLLPRRRRP